jgi:hypothetical protein
MPDQVRHDGAATIFEFINRWVFVKKTLLFVGLIVVARMVVLAAIS